MKDREAALHGRSFPTGHTSGAMLKALQKHLDATRGSAVVLTWLSTIRMKKDDLEDETRRFPLAVLHAGLAAFVDLASREAIADAAGFLVAPDNLGSWIRVLRGTTTPTEAFARIDATDSEYGRTTRWETTAAGPSSWRGRVHIAHDPALEQDGLLRLARMAELSAVPALFGFGRGRVGSFEAVTARGLGQEYSVEWMTVSAARTTGLGALGGGVLGVLPLVILSSGYGLTMTLACVASGALGGLGVARDRVRRADSLAQRTRVLALERSLLLREVREAEATSAIEGSVVAGQYRVVRRMGSGASGVIYEAVRVSDGLRVAIKLLRAVAAQDAMASDRLRREAEALGLAWHPNVVEVLDHGHLADGTSYLVMELLNGETLGAYLKARGRLSHAELLPIAKQICDALIAIHAAGVVHRDLKPSNIFVSRPKSDGAAPEGDRVKLIDFGIARVEWAETRITNMGMPVGTPGYMSPEQESGGEVDARSDVFAFGAVVYECLMGEPPPPTPSGAWAAIPESSLVQAVSDPEAIAGRRESMKLRLELIPVEWRPLLARTLAPAPSDRYQDARAVAQALRELEGPLLTQAARP